MPASRTITAGVGLSGGGDLSADRTIDLEDTAVVAGTYNDVTITVDAQGRITSATSGQAVSSLLFAGDYTDGDVSLTGNMATPTRDLYYAIGTVASGGCVYPTGGFRLFFKKLIATAGTIVFHNDGAAAVSNTGATGLGSNAGTLRVNSGTGASGNGNNGSAGSAAAGGNWPTSFRAGTGGTGGNGATTTTGGVGTATPTLATDATGSINQYVNWIQGALNPQAATYLAGGTGGGSGGGAATPTFLNGGGGGAGGGNCVVICGSVVTPANVTVRAAGGAGFEGAVGAGGGGGGGGGWAGIAVGAISAADLALITATAPGGVGGAAGAGASAGAQGASGKAFKFGGQ